MKLVLLLGAMVNDTPKRIIAACFALTLLGTPALARNPYGDKASGKTSDADAMLLSFDNHLGSDPDKRTEKADKRRQKNCDPKVWTAKELGGSRRYHRILLHRWSESPPRSHPNHCFLYRDYYSCSY
jgi:hypothetical protein